MTQQATLRALDAAIMAEFSSVGLTDAASYTQASAGGPAPPPVACTVYVDRGVGYQGFDGSARSDAITITALIEEIGSVPKRGAIFEVGAELFKVDSVEIKDESRVMCVVIHG